MRSAAGFWGSFPIALAVALTRTWVRLYTALLREDIRERRRCELESDLWEHRAQAARAGVPPTETACEVLARSLLGAPDDVLWRFGAARAESRAARDRHHAGGMDMTVSSKSIIAPSAFLGGTLWLLLVALGVLFVLTDTDPEESGWIVVFWGLAIVVSLVFIHSVVALLALDHGRIGRWGLRLFVAGASLTALTPLLALFEQWVWWVLPVGSIAVVTGWWAFALSNLTSRALPRWNRLPVLIGLIPLAGMALIELTDWVLAFGAGAFGIAWLFLAYALRQTPGTGAGGGAS